MGYDDEDEGQEALGERLNDKLEVHITEACDNKN